MSASPDAPTGMPPGPASPCINVCTINPATRQCVGCARTIDEITDWPTMSPQAQHALIDMLEVRKSAS